MKRATLFLAALWLVGCSGVITQPDTEPPLVAQANGQNRPVSEEEQSYLIITPSGAFETVDEPISTYRSEIESGWVAFALHEDSPHFSRLIWNGGDYYWESVPVLNQ